MNLIFVIFIAQIKEKEFKLFFKTNQLSFNILLSFDLRKKQQIVMQKLVIFFGNLSLAANN